MKQHTIYSFASALFISALLVLGLSAPLSAQTQSETIDIVTQGMGINKESALRNAYANAIQQALGAYVDAETMVKNNELIRDQVLTHSRGLIKKSEVVSESQEQGIHTVTVRAEVARQPLIEQFKPLMTQVVPTTIDGAGIYSQVVTQQAQALAQQQQAQDAQALLDKAIMPLMAPDRFNFEISGQRPEKNNTELLVTIRVTPNEAIHTQKRDAFMQVLEQIATSKTEESFQHTSEGLFRFGQCSSL